MSIAIVFSLLIAFIEELSEMNVTTNKLIIILTISFLSFLYMYLTRRHHHNIGTNEILNGFGITNPLSTPKPYVSKEEN